MNFMCNKQHKNLTLSFKITEKNFQNFFVHKVNMVPRLTMDHQVYSIPRAMTMTLKLPIITK